MCCQARKSNASPHGARPGKTLVGGPYRAFLKHRCDPPFSQAPF